MNQRLSIPRRIARIVFVVMSATTFFLASVMLSLQARARSALVKHDWGNPEFRRTAAVLFMLVTSTLAFVAAAFVLKTAKVWVLILLTVCNAFALAWLWRYTGGKDVVFVPPLTLSLICLLFEDYKVLAIMKGKMA
jgi:hypothetical protein